MYCTQYNGFKENNFSIQTCLPIDTVCIVRNVFLISNKQGKKPNNPSNKSFITLFIYLIETLLKIASF